MTVRRLFPLAVLLVVAGLVLAQPPAKTGNPEPKKDAGASKEAPRPAPGSLEDTLDKALRNSADIKSAEAKVREAEAELNRVRQQVLTRAASLHADLNLARRMVAVAERAVATQEGQVRAGLAPTETLLNAQAMVEKHRGEMEKIETELKSLRGEFAIRGFNYARVKSVTFDPDGRTLWTGEADGTLRVWDVTTGALIDKLTPAPAAAVQTPMMDRVKKLLDQEVTFNLTDTDPQRAVQALLDAAKSDIPLRVLLPAEQHPVTLRGKLSVGACLQAIEDTDPAIRIVVRDYGLLLIHVDRVPEGALRVQDVWKGNYAVPKKTAEPKGK